MSDLFGKIDKHPSYGTVQFNRISIGGTKTYRLFGSPLRNHMAAVTLTIRRAERYNRYGEDHVHGHGELIEVTLSSAQFADLLTTMNAGSGVPCTIRHIAGERVPEPPGDEVEIDRAQSSFKDNMKEFVDNIYARKEEIAKILDKKAINKGDRKAIHGLVQKVLDEVSSNMPFALDQFNEASDRVASAAKAEVDAFVTNAITNAGLEQLAKGTAQRLLEGEGMTK